MLVLRRGALGPLPAHNGEEKDNDDNAAVGGWRVGGDSFDHLMLPSEYIEAHGPVRLVAVMSFPSVPLRACVRARARAGACAGVCVRAHTPRAFGCGWVGRWVSIHTHLHTCI